MNSNFGYTGKVTFKSIFKGRTISTQYLNNGTSLLFESYARALAGQNISEVLPAYLNIYYTKKSENPSLNSETHSFLRNSKGAGVVRTVDRDEDGKLLTRLSVSITRDMMDIDDLETSNDVSVELQLLTDILPTTGAQGVLATVDVDNPKEFTTSILETPYGIQFIIVWDLYVDNINKEGES